MTPATVTNIASSQNSKLEQNSVTPPEIFYPSEDGEPLAETSIHADAIIVTVGVLRNYLASKFSERSPVVLADQFLYYAQGFPKLRVSPDIMLIFEIPQVPYDNYKIWDTGKVPSIIFEITSPKTQAKDKEFKRNLYEDIGVQEYWLFDPKGEWIPEKLRGYRLDYRERDEDYIYYPITDGQSHVLGLRLEVQEHLIDFYELETGEKLLMPFELNFALQHQKQLTVQESDRAEQERLRAEQEATRANAAELEAQKLRDRLIALGINPDEIT
ncbi:MAG: Uma2 family endonuclease [Pseudanabaena sp. M57BS1SP1A06MG]|nr:Uma2 family endonuclease [Pseudanabaena sp. M53BS1SP1A06MG]MCA6583684.1 Uma2 family endonuclease [Pseudanabaena sp. M34BS1SP1A06MG]MCA6591987.1 Uma2 family endonuclease [Pseudanabaena sp. M38BS1SP1A06MG]MCA6600558.1 Uma2 family endonuclease [Pseudanabaena sp. M57BS1SP1A06MG]